MLRAVRRLVVYGVYATLATLLGVYFFKAFSSAVAREQETACLALEPRIDGRQAFDFERPDFFGQGRVSLTGLRGKLVFLNFWATWCPPCVDEMPSMEQLAQRFRDKEFAMVAVSVDDKDDDVRRFFPKGTAMTVLRDPQKEISRRYGTEKYPETYLIDGNGRILYHFINKRDWNHPAAARCIEANL
jgi:thiol-disulfide isomerase/thioredoxin